MPRDFLRSHLNEITFSNQIYSSCFFNWKVKVKFTLEQAMKAQRGD
jgi:hypothetical protein